MHVRQQVGLKSGSDSMMSTAIGALENAVRTRSSSCTSWRCWPWLTRRRTILYNSTPTLAARSLIDLIAALRCHGTLQGRGLLKSHGLSETPIVWRNTSDTFTPRLLRHYCEFNSFRLWTVNQFVLKKKVMVDAVPVLADNPCGTVLVLVSLYLVPKKTSGETQQSL